MKPPPFDYVAPASLAEVLAELATHGDEALPLAGGQSLVPMLALRVARPSVIIDLRRIEELQGISAQGQALRVGAMTRQVEVLKSPAVAQALPGLADAVRLVGHFQTRNRGTIGGSVALGEPAAENPAFAVALDAELELDSARGIRTVRASDFYSGPYMTERADDELLTAITYRPPANAKIGIDEIVQRRGDFALSGAVACLSVSNGTISEARLAWFGMATRPVRASAAEQALRGATVAGLNLREIADLALAETEPTDDAHATADYRRDVGRVLMQRLLKRVLN